MTLPICNRRHVALGRCRQKNRLFYRFITWRGVVVLRDHRWLQRHQANEGRCLISRVRSARVLRFCTLTRSNSSRVLSIGGVSPSVDLTRPRTTRGETFSARRASRASGYQVVVLDFVNPIRPSGRFRARVGMHGGTEPVALPAHSPAG
jgi:hypothetical protein